MRYVIGIDPGSPGYDCSAEVCVRLNDDGSMTVVGIRTSNATVEHSSRFTINGSLLKVETKPDWSR